jgi:hypothetical protein
LSALRRVTRQQPDPEPFDDLDLQGALDPGRRQRERIRCRSSPAVLARQHCGRRPDDRRQHRPGAQTIIGKKEKVLVSEGAIPAHWKPTRRRWTDKDARWTKKHGKSSFGYKVSAEADKRYKLVRCLLRVSSPSTI